MFTNEDNRSLTWLGKFIYKSFQRRNSVGSSLWNICWYDFSCIHIYICMYIYIYTYIKLLYIAIKSSSYVHAFYTSKCIHILLTAIYFRLPGPVYVFCYFMMSLMIMRTVLVIWLLYGSPWFYTNDFIPALCILCMFMYVPPNLILHGLNTPRIIHGLYTSRTIRFIYISGCILTLCCF